MKKFFFIFMCLCLLVSCTKDEFINEFSQNQAEGSNIDTEIVTKCISLNGEFTVNVNDLYYSPVKTRSSVSSEGNTDMYGVQVYSKDSIGADSIPYAYGLFTNLSDIKVDLIKNKMYTVVCRCVKNGKNILPMYTTNSGTYDRPFGLLPYGVTAISNEFTYTSDFYFRDISHYYGCARIGNRVYDHPSIESFDGTVYNYNPNDTIDLAIALKRVSYGVKVVVNNLTDGHVSVNINQSEEIKIQSTDSIKTNSKIFTLDGGTPNWTSDGYFEDILTKISYINSNGIENVICNQNLTFYRNKETTITITIPSENESNNKTASMSLESGNMGSSSSNYNF